MKKEIRVIYVPEKYCFAALLHENDDTVKDEFGDPLAIFFDEEDGLDAALLWLKGEQP